MPRLKLIRHKQITKKTFDFIFKILDAEYYISIVVVIFVCLLTPNRLSINFILIECGNKNVPSSLSLSFVNFIISATRYETRIVKKKKRKAFGNDDKKVKEINFISLSHLEFPLF